MSHSVTEEYLQGPGLGRAFVYIAYTIVFLIHETLGWSGLGALWVRVDLSINSFALVFMYPRGLDWVAGLFILIGYYAFLWACARLEDFWFFTSILVGLGLFLSIVFVGIVVFVHPLALIGIGVCGGILGGLLVDMRRKVGTFWEVQGYGQVFLASVLPWLVVFYSLPTALLFYGLVSISSFITAVLVGLVFKPVWANRLVQRFAVLTR